METNEQRSKRLSRRAAGLLAVTITLGVLSVLSSLEKMTEMSIAAQIIEFCSAFLLGKTMSKLEEIGCEFR